MSTALKDRYTVDFVQTLERALQQVTPSVDTSTLIQDVFTEEFAKFELKQRMTHFTRVLNNILSPDFSVACDQLVQTTRALANMGIGENFEYMFLPEYVSNYGIDTFETAMLTLGKITSFTSAEFAVRSFINKYPEAAMAKMLAWSTNHNPKIRRLASEGSRPRLPWAMALPEFKKDPTPTLPILENLKNDNEEVVRRSVANHLNDISKDNPKLAVEMAYKWFGETPETDSVVKHAMRSLLKQGHPEIMKLFGLDATHLAVESFKVNTPIVQLGNRLSFSFKIVKDVPEPITTRIEFVIYLLKQNGTHSKKVFKISERRLVDTETLIEKQHHIKPITTRVYYSGVHYVAIILNGKEYSRQPFTLQVD